MRLEIKSLGSPEGRRAESAGRKTDSYGRKVGKEQPPEARKQGDGSESRTSDLEYSEKYSR